MDNCHNLANDKLAQKHAEVPPDYYETGLENNLWQRIWHTRRIKEMLKIIPAGKEKYLDLGCHGGFLTQKAADKCQAREIWGIDVSLESVKYAQNKYPDFHFTVADAANLPFDADSFDLITCFEMLEHVLGPRKILEEIKRCLKKGGEVVILVPTESLFFRIIWYFWTHLGRGKVWQETHINKIKADDLENILEKMGFKIIQTKKTHLGMLKAVQAKLKG